MKKELVLTSTEELIGHILTLPQADTQLEHLFIDGMYARTLHVPADCLLVGKVHKKACFNILSKGSMIVKAENGEEGIRIDAPWIGISYAGSQKTGYTLTECTFINVFKTEADSVDEAEEDIAESLYEKLEGI